MQQLGCESHSVTCVSCYVHVYGNKVIIIIIIIYDNNISPGLLMIIIKIIILYFIQIRHTDDFPPTGTTASTDNQQ